MMVAQNRLTVVTGALVVFAGVSALGARHASAQSTGSLFSGSLNLRISPPSVLRDPPAARPSFTDPAAISPRVDEFAVLEQRLTNRLRATQDDQRAFVRFVVTQVRTGKLDAPLVAALERYALRRDPKLPFNYFQRALRFEAGRRGINVPSVRLFASERILP